MNNVETNAILREILKWQRLQGIENLKKKVKTEDLFGKPDYILVYGCSDGNKSSRKIEKATGVNYKTVMNLWKKWVDAGIAEPTEKYGGGRCRRLFELSELGIELPKQKRK